MLLLYELQKRDGLESVEELLNAPKVMSLTHRATVNKLQKDFDKLTSRIYYIKDGKHSERLASRREMGLTGSDEYLNEYLYADEEIHMEAAAYQYLAVVLWCSTLVNRFAKAAKINVVYEKNKGQFCEAAVENEGLIKKALKWYIATDTKVLLADCIKEAVVREGSVVYPDDDLMKITPYVDWESAARGIAGFSMISKSGAAMSKYKRNAALLPHEKAEFIRDYIIAEKKLQKSASREVVREVKEMCIEVQKMLKEYPQFDDGKAEGIIATLSRSDYTRCSERQGIYLKNLRKTMQDFKLMKESKPLDTLPDIDDDFEDSEEDDGSVSFAGLFG